LIQFFQQIIVLVSAKLWFEPGSNPVRAMAVQRFNK
jgi:hypothetical protein